MLLNMIISFLYHQQRATGLAWYNIIHMRTDFFVAGRTRNIPQILEVCKALDSVDKTYYCFAKNEDSHKKAGLDLHTDPNQLAEDFERRELGSESVRAIFEDDLDGLKLSNNFLLVLPAGKSAHIEAGIAYGLGKHCYAIGSYEKTDSLYLIFDKIFASIEEMKEYFGQS